MYRDLLPYLRQFARQIERVHQSQVYRQLHSHQLTGDDDKNTRFFFRTALFLPRRA